MFEPIAQLTIGERFPRLAIVMVSLVIAIMAVAICEASLNAVGYTTVLSRWGL